MPVCDSGPVLLCDISTGVARPIVPETYRRQVFNVIHSLAHPGRKTTQKLISEKFVWHGLKKEVNQWAKECIHCQTSKVQTHVRAPIDNFKVPEKRFSHIHVDIVGPLPPSCGHIPIFPPSMTAQLVGRKPSHFKERQPLTVPERSLLHGSPVLEFHLTLHPPEELNLLQPFGPLFLNSSVVNCTTLLHTIPEPMVWWNAAIVL